MVLFDQKKLLSEYKNLLKGPRFRLFTALSMPTAWLAGLKIIQLDDNLCVTSLPGGWRSQNPFKTMYWAVQGMGAELSTGAASFALSKNSSKLSNLYNFL